MAVEDLCECEDTSSCNDDCDTCTFSSGAVFCDEFDTDSDEKHTETDTHSVTPGIKVPIIEYTIPTADIVTDYHFKYTRDPQITSCDFKGLMNVGFTIVIFGGEVTVGLDFDLQSPTAEDVERHVSSDGKSYYYTFKAVFDFHYSLALGPIVLAEDTVSNAGVTITTPSYPVPGFCKCPHLNCSCPEPTN